jgi:transglutaminase-like putative cysteine protease
MSSSVQPETAAPAAEGAQRYRIRHTSAYRYGADIVLAHHLLHLTPRPAANQRVGSFRLTIDPPPSVLARHDDYFGNPVTYLELHEPHMRLSIGAEFEVEVAPPAYAVADLDAPWDRLAASLSAAQESAGQESATQDSAAEDPAAQDPAARAAAAYGFGSEMIALSAELRDYALPSFPAGRPIGAAALDLTLRINKDFVFDPGATTIATPVAEVLAKRRGVCQDFAHLQIGCLRALGLAARYVSGYLRTVPPAGRPRSVGADVSHAWLSVWCGGDRWLDLDPTNGRPGSTDLIALAIGRDYGDVSPTRGVILGSSIQYLTVSVDVAPRD